MANALLLKRALPRLLLLFVHQISLLLFVVSVNSNNNKVPLTLHSSTARRGLLSPGSTPRYHPRHLSTFPRHPRHFLDMLPHFLDMPRHASTCPVIPGAGTTRAKCEHSYSDCLPFRRTPSPCLRVFIGLTTTSITWSALPVIPRGFKPQGV